MTYINNNGNNGDKDRWKGYAFAGLAGGVLGTGGHLWQQRIIEKLESTLKNPPSPSEVDSKFTWTNPILKDSYEKSKKIRAAKFNRLERGALLTLVRPQQELNEALKSGKNIELTDADIPKALKALKHETPFAERALRSSLLYAGILGLGYGVYDLFFRPKNKP